MTQPARKPKPHLPSAIHQLRAAVARLTEPTQAYINSRYIEIPGLYQQLTAAVHGQQSNAGNGGGSRSRPPFWTDAVDQLHNIDLMVNVWPTDSAGNTLTQLRALANKTWTVEDTKQVRRLAGIINAWANDIETLLAGTHSKHISAPCPACAAETIQHYDSGGELVRAPALQITKYGCTCQNCKHTWSPDQYLLLAEVLGCERPAGVLE